MSGLSAPDSMDTPVSALLQDMFVGAADNRLEEQNHATATHLQTCTAVNSKRAYDPKVVEFMVFNFTKRKELA